MNGLVRTKRTKIVATRHVLWAPNVPKIPFPAGALSRPDPAGGAYLIALAPDPLAEFKGEGKKERKEGREE